MKNKEKPLFPNLEAELSRQGFTQKAYGEALGLSQASVSARMNGFTQFTLSEIYKTIQLLQKNFSELF